MQKSAIAILGFVALPLLAQAPRSRPVRPASVFPDYAEAAVKQAMEQFGTMKKISDRDVEVLQHVRTADSALTDPMQLSNAVQKAAEEVNAAVTLEQDARIAPPEFVLLQGLFKVRGEIANANLSPMTADFGHLRTVLREYALGPASRAAVRDASAMQAETIAWLRVQQLIAEHLRALSEQSGAALHASEQ